MEIHRLSGYKHQSYNTHFTGFVKKPVTDLVRLNLAEVCEYSLNEAKQLGQKVDDKCLIEFANYARGIESSLSTLMERTHKDTYFSHSCSPDEYGNININFEIGNPVMKDTIKINLFESIRKMPFAKFNPAGNTIDVGIDLLFARVKMKNNCGRNLRTMFHMADILKKDIKPGDIDSKVLDEAEIELLDAIGEKTLKQNEIDSWANKIENYAQKCGIQTTIREKIISKQASMREQKMVLELEKQRLANDTSNLNEINRATVQAILEGHGYGNLPIQNL